MPFTEAQLTCDKFLGGKLHLYQPKAGYRAATDPVLLAAACPAKQGETVLDIGCGVGTASFCLATRVPVRLTGLELQPDYAQLANKNAEENGFEMEVLCDDLAQMPMALKERTFDHVIMNPPFFGPGARSPDKGRAIARQANTGIGDWVDAGLRRLRPRGWLTLIQTIEWLPNVVVALNGRAGGLEIKPLSPRAHRPATRFVIRAMKGSRANALLSNPLILHAGDSHTGDADDYTDAAKAILRDGEPLKF